ncbi:MAG: hypothetical protein ACHP7N_03205 [Caulobacterales bacterium]
MSDAQRLALVRGVHTAIYLVMVAATFVVLYAGVSGARGAWLWPALGLVSVESAVFVGGGFKCPLSALAVKYGATTGELFDTFIPERLTRYTFRVFGPLIAVGLVLLAARWLGLVATATAPGP